MDKHDFDPEAHSIQELVDFCERLEAVEQRHKGNNSNTNQNSEWQLAKWVSKESQN